MNQGRILTAALALWLVPAALHGQAVVAGQDAQPVAQQVAQAITAEPSEAAAPTLRQQLMPAAAAALARAPLTIDRVAATEAKTVAQPAAYSRGSGTVYMIVGAALFAAGIIADNDASTVLILAGAGIGAYGIYLHFR